MPDDGDKASFLGHELEKWERVEDKLAAWALRDDGSPNPFSPPFDAGHISLIIAGLNSRLDCLNYARVVALAS